MSKFRIIALKVLDDSLKDRGTGQCLTLGSVREK